MQRDTWAGEKVHGMDWVQVQCTSAEEIRHGTWTVDWAECPDRIQMVPWEKLKVASSVCLSASRSLGEQARAS